MVEELSKFKRGIKNGSRAFSLSNNFFSSTLGKKIRLNKEFKICIRHNYFNIYWNGCSILKYNPLARLHTYCIHHKYVGCSRLSESNPYVQLNPKSNNGDLNDLVYGDWSFSEKVLGSIRNGQMSPVIEKYIKGSAEDSEKKNLSRYLEEENPCWIDLEVAFSRPSKNKTGEDITVADRIDLAVIDDRGVDKPVLKFIEVKMANDSRLKKKDNDLPSVCKKMRIYKENFLDNQSNSIFESYKLVAQNMIDFGLVADRSELVKRWVDGGIVDPYPYLLILSGENKLAVHHSEKIAEWMKTNEFPSGGFRCHHFS